MKTLILIAIIVFLAAVVRSQYLEQVERYNKRKDDKAGTDISKVAGYFGITENEPFSGEFYFETQNQQL